MLFEAASKQLLSVQSKTVMLANTQPRAWQRKIDYLSMVSLKSHQNPTVSQGYMS